jgi:hypothetical protein
MTTTRMASRVTQTRLETSQYMGDPRVNDESHVCFIMKYLKRPCKDNLQHGRLPSSNKFAPIRRVSANKDDTWLSWAVVSPTKLLAQPGPL